ncbi:hypothetical protein EI94DRAFT_1325175 [Lactarius quietus]|nr:hypothetical protein EI94DRAFT_1325175 [Lactarius quietus]
MQGSDTLRTWLLQCTAAHLALTPDELWFLVEERFRYLCSIANTRRSARGEVGTGRQAETVMRPLHFKLFLNALDRCVSWFGLLQLRQSSRSSVGSKPCPNNYWENTCRRRRWIHKTKTAVKFRRPSLKFGLIHTLKSCLKHWKDRSKDKSQALACRSGRNRARGQQMRNSFSTTRENVT